MISRTAASLLLTGVLAAVSAPVPRAAADAVAHFTVSGTSTVRAWSCPADGTARPAPGKGAPPVPGFPAGMQAVTVTVPVRAIACETDLMNDHLRETLKEKTNPSIVFELQQYTIAGSDAKATGTLTIAGVTKPLTLEIKVMPEQGGLRGVGETVIDLTQFGLTPPVIFEGLLKVGKDVRVKFDATLHP